MILVTGATGLVGGATARALVSDGIRPRLLLRRDPSGLAQAAERDSVLSDAQIVVADFDRPQTLEHALEGVEAALLASPSNPEMLRQQGAFIDAAARWMQRGQAIRLVKLSGFLTELDSSSQSGRWHAELESRISAAGLVMTSLRPPFFMQNLLRQGATALVSGTLAAPLPSATIAMVDARDIGAVAARCLQDPQHAGQSYLVTGPEALSFADVAAQLSELSERSVRHVPDSLAQARERLVASGAPPWRVDVVMEFSAGFAAGKGAEVSDVVQRITGAEPHSLRRFFNAHRSELGL
jgi:uncharacterized protein YbjT (DUF2867 family)